jgi:uncharacterized repeat protein (TIGR04076 family)
MPKMKITVLKRMFNQALAEAHCQPNTEICPRFAEGQEFIVEGLKQPEGFCDWAWDDIHKCYMTLMFGGSFTPWMKEKNNIIACCTDGIRPVVFNIERIED